MKFSEERKKLAEKVGRLKASGGTANMSDNDKMEMRFYDAYSGLFDDEMNMREDIRTNMIDQYFDHIESAARQGYALAQYVGGVLFINSEDYGERQTGAEFLKKAAAQGLVEAQQLYEATR
jgi:hypothetical protein